MAGGAIISVSEQLVSAIVETCWKPVSISYLTFLNNIRSYWKNLMLSISNRYLCPVWSSVLASVMVVASMYCWFCGFVGVSGFGLILMCVL